MSVSSRGDGDSSLTRKTPARPPSPFTDIPRSGYIFSYILFSVVFPLYFHEVLHVALYYIDTVAEVWL